MRFPKPRRLLARDREDDGVELTGIEFGQTRVFTLPRSITMFRRVVRGAQLARVLNL